MHGIPTEPYVFTVLGPDAFKPDVRVSVPSGARLKLDGERAFPHKTAERALEELGKRVRFQEGDRIVQVRCSDGAIFLWPIKFEDVIVRQATGLNYDPKDNA